MTQPNDISPNQLDLFATDPTKQLSNTELNVSFDPSSGVTNPNVTEEKQFFNHPEWCYQFFDDEPVVFAFSKESGEPGNKTPLQIVLDPVKNGGIFFKSKGMTFKIFARELSEASRLELEAAKAKEQNPTG